MVVYHRLKKENYGRIIVGRFKLHGRLPTGSSGTPYRRGGWSGMTELETRHP